MFFRWLIYIPIIILMLVLYLEYPGWLSLFLFIITISIPFISLLSILPFRKKISFDLQFRSFLYPGETERIKVLVKQSGEISRFFTGTLLVADIASKDGDIKSIRSGSDLLEYVPEHCGAYLVTLLRPGISDPLSFFRLPLKRLEPEHFYVIPKKKAIDEKIDLSGLSNSSFVKKPGGGAAEAYEIRSYQPGDPVNDIHWKLSAKSKDDSLMVKEAQERALKDIIITFDIERDRDKRDLMFSHLMWLLCDLCEKGLSPTCVYYSENEKKERHLQTEEDINELFCTILALPYTKDLKSLSEEDFSGRGWHYHVS